MDFQNKNTRILSYSFRYHDIRKKQTAIKQALNSVHTFLNYLVSQENFMFPQIILVFR